MTCYTMNDTNCHISVRIFSTDHMTQVSTYQLRVIVQYVLSVADRTVFSTWFSSVAHLHLALFLLDLCCWWLDFRTWIPLNGNERHLKVYFMSLDRGSVHYNGRELFAGYLMHAENNYMSLIFHFSHLDFDEVMTQWSHPPEWHLNWDNVTLSLVNEAHPC